LLVFGDHSQNVVSAAIFLDFWGGWIFFIFVFVFVFIVKIPGFLVNMNFDGIVLIDFVFW
jgi:hypothetical protein